MSLFREIYRSMFGSSDPRERIPSLADRYSYVHDYMDRLVESHNVPREQIDLLHRAYKWFHNNDIYEYRGRDFTISDPLVFSVLRKESDISIIDVSKDLDRKKIEKSKSAREKTGFLVNAPIRGCDVMVSPFFQESVYVESGVDRAQAIKEVAEYASLTKPQYLGDIGRPEVYVGIKMNGPLPCVVLSSRRVLVVEPQWRNVCFMGLVSARTPDWAT